MAPQRNNNNEQRHSSNTGTIPKSKVRNNCNVPQEAVTPTRRDMSSSLGSTSLDWVPVSEYNSRSNYNQSRKPTNNTSDQELNDLDNSASFESGFGRFVPVRPQPRVLPLTVQNRESLAVDHNDDGSIASGSGYLHPYPHHVQNGLMPQSNHAAAAVMIVNPTTPNAVSSNLAQPYGASTNQNRNNITRNLNSSRNNFEGNSNSRNGTPPVSNTRAAAKTVNLINNMYESGQGSSNNLNENGHGQLESARALGEAIVSACTDAVAVERRLGQIREYIRVTSSLVDTMRNSEDEAYIEHTKEEYDELVEMVMKLKESEGKLEQLLLDKQNDEEVAFIDAGDQNAAIDEALGIISPIETHESLLSPPLPPLKKVNNEENVQTYKNLQSNSVVNVNEDDTAQGVTATVADVSLNELKKHPTMEHLEKIIEIKEEIDDEKTLEITEVETLPLSPTQELTPPPGNLNDVLKQNILSCIEKVAKIEEIKQKNGPSDSEIQDAVRPMSVQSNGSAFSDNELWQNEIKNKMELSHQRLAGLKHQHRRLLKFQEETKQQLEEINLARSAEDLLPSTSHDNLTNMHSRGPYVNNQIGIATTLPHSHSDSMQQLQHVQQLQQAQLQQAQLQQAQQIQQAQQLQQAHMQQVQQNIVGSSITNNDDSQHDRYMHSDMHSRNEEVMGGHGDSECEDEEGSMVDRRRQLAYKLRQLQLKKQHMENMVSEFQKIQMGSRLGVGAVSHNNYSSSGDDSADDAPSRKSNNASGGKNDDPFKLMEIKAIKAALQKTKDLMRSVENYESDQMSGILEDPFQIINHSNVIHDRQSEGGSTGGGWSNEGSVRRNSQQQPPRRKFTNEHHMQQHANNHEANIASLQELAQEMRLETEKIMGERARLKDLVSNKEFQRKQKKVNEEVRASTSGAPGPVERRQLELKALLAEKQKELESLLNKEKVLTVAAECQKINSDSQAGSMINQSYNSEQEEMDSRSEQIIMDSQSSRDNSRFMAAGDNGPGVRSINTLPSHLGSIYGSDSDSASRTNPSQRTRGRRRQTQQERQMDDSNVSQSNSVHNLRHEPRMDAPNVNMVPPITQTADNTTNMPYPHLPPPLSWSSSNKTNQDMRANQFTQNSHSQTMDRLLGTPPMTYPPSMPFNMMMPYGMVGGCGCGCNLWAAWCWQQIVMQQREMQHLREQVSHLEERWRAESGPHTLNNQVPPGNRANNYWDNFRSYSRQNLLSASSKSNADGHLGVGPVYNPHPLVERSHNALHPPAAAAVPPANTPKRNVNHAAPNNDDNRQRRNLTYERSLSFSSAPDVLNVNQTPEDNHPTRHGNDDPRQNVNLNYNELSHRNLNISDVIPEIIQSHSNNINTSPHTKKKSSTKLPAKNSSSRRNYLDYSQTSNINIASSSETNNPNLATTSQDHNKATKIFDLLRENVYSEVTALIGVNESHPDFLIQLFRDLQQISSEPVRQRVLQSIRSVLTQYPHIIDNHNSGGGSAQSETIPDTVSTTTETYNVNVMSEARSGSGWDIQNDYIYFLTDNDNIITPMLLERLASMVVNSSMEEERRNISKKRVLETLSKYEGIRVSDVSADIMESITRLKAGNFDHEHTPQANPMSEPLQDVAGSMNMFSSSDTQLREASPCPFELWSVQSHMHSEGSGSSGGNSREQERQVDLINCTEMQNGDLAEADQTHSDVAGGSEEVAMNGDGLPDVVDTEETTPTEAEAEWLGLDRVPTRLHMEETSEKQKD